MTLNELIAEMDQKTERLAELAAETRKVERQRRDLRGQIASLLGLNSHQKKVRPRTGIFSRVIAALTDDPQTPIQLADKLGFDNGSVGSTLRSLTEQGKARQVSRGLYARRANEGNGTTAGIR